MKTIIKVRTVGARFGHVARIYRGRRCVWSSRVVPWGFASEAARLAEREAEARGWPVADDEY